jgi:hypothetical protein
VLGPKFYFLIYWGRSLFLTEEERELEAKEAAEREKEVHVARMREERERQRAADLKHIKQQRQRGEEAARRAEVRRRQPPAATTAVTQDGAWRRSGSLRPSTGPHTLAVRESHIVGPTTAVILSRS